jgi:hypothetical protein
MFHRGLVKDQPPGRGVKALFFPACYKLSAELGLLLGARKSPALIIATHHESRTPAVTYFQPRGTTAIVEEVCFFGRTEGDSLASCQLTIYGNGEQARVYGPGISADLGSQELTRFITELLTKWADSHNSPGL